MKRLMKTAVPAIAVLLALAFISGCPDPESGAPNTEDPKIGTEAQAFILVVEALPDINDIEIIDKEDINGALSLYANLPEQDKTAEKVLEAKNKAEALLDRVAGLEFAAAVNALPNPATTANYSAAQRDTANAQNAAYGGLSEAVKAVPEIAEARARLDGVLARIKAAEFAAAVNALPAVNALVIADKPAVDAAADLYEALPETAKAYPNAVAAKTGLEERAARIAELAAMDGLSQAAQNFLNAAAALPADTAGAEARHVGAVFNAKNFYDSVTVAGDLADASVVAAKTRLDAWLPAVEPFRQLPARIRNPPAAEAPRMLHVYSTYVGFDVGIDSNAVGGGEDYRLSRFLQPQQGHVHGMQIAVYESVASTGTSDSLAQSTALQAQIDTGTVTPVGYFWTICGFGDNGLELNQGYFVPSLVPHDVNSLPNRNSLVAQHCNETSPGIENFRVASLGGTGESIANFRMMITEMIPGWTEGTRAFRFTARFVATDSGAFITGPWATVTFHPINALNPLVR